MIKVSKHRLTCACEDCQTAFPPDRFEATWTVPAPDPTCERVIGRVPLGAPNASWGFVVWIDADQRLAHDWPGFPGTRGARVELDRPGRPKSDKVSRVITGTRDPALAALSDRVPLRRLTTERINARCMVEYGLADDDVADFIACERHGIGLPALACVHVLGAEAIDATVVYGVDGDYPDLFCAACLARYAAGELAVAHTVCSHCQQAHLYRHRLVGHTHYGAGDPR